MRLNRDALDPLVYDFVRDFVAEHGYGPSLREIRGSIGCGLTRVQESVDRLVEEGRLGRLPGKWRSLHAVEPVAPHPMVGDNIRAVPPSPAIISLFADPKA